MQRYNLPNKLRISITALQNFLEQMESGYSKYRNPYHNLIHAADVLQTTYQIIYNSGLMNWLSDHELFAMFIAAIVHDFEHTGTSNNFHIQSRSDVALIYNDRAVLENHHVSAAFRLMRIDDYNILAEFNADEYKNFRHLVIEMVLATDMSSHFTQLKTMKSLLSMPENIEKAKALALVLHCADISHPGKPWIMHQTWTQSLMEEFFKQGEKEKELGLPCSPLCDRENTLVAESQIGFIQYIVEPSFVVMGDMLEKVLRSLSVSDSELPSPSIAAKSVDSSPSPSLSAESSNESNNPNDDPHGSEIKLPASMTTPIPRPVSLRRPWADFLKSNRERWIREAEEERNRKELNVIEEEP
jgi:calcium/calmodulin-dependent 3',5'-cyclic nucleotide phosphodiesterase